MSSTSKLNFKVTNNSGIADDKVSIGFWGSLLNVTINGVAMTKNKWYPLTDFKSIVMDVTTSGRFYIAYNDTFTPNGDAMPSILVPGEGAYGNRYDKFELTFDGTPYGVADLTAIDFWSIPMSLTTELNGKPTGKVLHGINSGVTGEDIYTALSAVSNPIESLATGTNLIDDFKNAGNPLPTGVQDAIKSPANALITDSNGDFVRIIGPNSYPSFGDPSKTNLPPGLPFTPYNTFQDYFNYLISTFGPGKTSPKAPSLGNGKIAHIQGEYGGSTKGTTAPFLKQSYDVWASIDADCNLTIAGTSGEVGAISLKVSKWDLLSPASTYGGSPVFYEGGTKNTQMPNNIYAWIFGDFFAGLNIGAIGSSVTVNGNIVGDMKSSEWFSQLPANGNLFDKLWLGGETNFWNQWAQELNPKSDAYNFAYAERFSSPQISVAPANADTITLELLKADVTS